MILFAIERLGDLLKMALSKGFISSWFSKGIYSLWNSRNFDRSVIVDQSTTIIL